MSYQSSVISHQHWNLCQIHVEYDYYSEWNTNTLILHIGRAYAASALSFMFQNLGKPVVVRL